MQSVGMEVDQDRDLTIVTVSGILELEQVLAVLTREGFGRTGRVLWDLRDASVSSLTTEKLQQIAEGVSRVTGKRATRGTAIVTNSYNAQLVIELYFEIATHRYGRKLPGFATTCLDEAEEWLLGI